MTGLLIFVYIWLSVYYNVDGYSDTCT